MVDPQRPTLPIPPPIAGSEHGSWANSTIVERLPNIARRLLDENDLSPTAQRRLQTLIEHIPEGPIRLLDDTSASDWRDWDAHIAPYAGQSWLQPPFFFVETYFYRRILEAVDYFEARVDPFRHQKEQGLLANRNTIRVLAERLEGLRAADDEEVGLNFWLAGALWGNRSDLSLWPAESESLAADLAGQGTAARMLVDDRARAIAHLTAGARSGARLDIVLDNAGLELIADLCLADFWLKSQAARSVRLHVKAHPTFVSDATARDLVVAITFLTTDKHRATAALGRRLQRALAGDRLQWRAHPFWTSALSGWEMPDTLRADLRQARLVICKGDANYRRILGDRHWSFSASFETILHYFPAPMLALRTAKSELFAGLHPAQPAVVRRRDIDWLTSGRWGVIQQAGIVSPGNIAMD